jgi:hypothetical protein
MIRPHSPFGRSAGRPNGRPVAAPSRRASGAGRTTVVQHKKGVRPRCPAQDAGHRCRLRPGGDSIEPAVVIDEGRG